MENHVGKTVTALQGDWPDWHVWYVPRAIGGLIWCAQRWDDEMHVLNADSVDGLVELLEAEAGR